MMFHYTEISSKSLEDTIESLEGHLKDEQFGVLWDFNINEKLESKGFNLQNRYRVLEVCNPKEAYNVLTQDPLVSYFLPCKIVVYEDQGSVKVGMPRPTALISMVNDSNLKAIAEGIETRLITCIKASL